jgi:hypothetical protein
MAATEAAARLLAAPAEERRHEPHDCLVILAGGWFRLAAAPPRRRRIRWPRLGAAERLQALVERVRFEQSQLQSLEAEFVQRRERALVEPEEARHLLLSAARPSALYIRVPAAHHDDPRRRMTTWYRDLGRAERNIGLLNQVMRHPGAAGIETLMQYFTLRVSFPPATGEPYRLDLAPRYERIAKRLQSMTLWLDSRTFLPSRLRYSEADGDSTEYRFSAMRANAVLPAERFELALPPGIEVRSLELARGATH